MTLAIDTRVVRAVRAGFADVSSRLRPPRSSPGPRARIGAAGATVLVGTAIGMWCLTSPDAADRVWPAFFVVVAPAVAIARMLPSLELVHALVIGVAGAATLNVLVVETMLAADMWSITGGTIAVAALAGLLWLIPSARDVSDGDPDRPSQ